MSWKCLKCGYANEDYLIVCVCGQYKKEQQAKLSPPLSPLLWICPSCLSKNSIEQLLCKCSFRAINTEISAYLENQTSADLYDNIIFNRKNGSKDRAKFLLSYLLKRYPNSKEAISEKKGCSEPQRKREEVLSPPEKQKDEKLKASEKREEELVAETRKVREKQKEDLLLTLKAQKEERLCMIAKQKEENKKYLKKRLDEVKELFDLGVIREDEYNRGRKEVLDLFHEIDKKLSSEIITEDIGLNHFMDKPQQNNSEANMAINVKKAVVTVLVAESQGSGFCISKNGMIITNAHVVGDNKTAKIMFSDGKEMQAKVIKVDRNKDIAVVITFGSDLPFVLMGDSNNCQQMSSFSFIPQLGSVLFPTFFCAKL